MKTLDTLKGKTLLYTRSLALLILCSATGAQAATVALTGVTGGIYATSGADQLYGWFFDTSQAITVTDLGVHDRNDDGLGQEHEVGVFRVSDQSLLLSALLPAGTGATLVNGWRYTSVAPVALPAGSYVIVMTMPELSPDQQLIDASGATTSSPVTYVDSAFGGSSVLAYPSNAGSFAEGMFGPNFMFTAVPEPASGLLVIGGGIAVALLRRRRVVVKQAR